MYYRDKNERVVKKESVDMYLISGVLVYACVREKVCVCLCRKREAKERKLLCVLTAFDSLRHSLGQVTPFTHHHGLFGSLSYQVYIIHHSTNIKRE